MEVKVKIKTPKGMALKLEPKLRTVLMPLGAKSKTMILKEDDVIFWIVECNVKQMLKLHRSVLMFDKMMVQVFKNKSVNKLIKSSLNKPEDYEVLKELFKHQTTVELIKNDTDLDI